MKKSVRVSSATKNVVETDVDVGFLPIEDLDRPFGDFDFEVDEGLLVLYTELCYILRLYTQFQTVLLCFAVIFLSIRRYFAELFLYMIKLVKECIYGWDIYVYIRVYIGFA